MIPLSENILIYQNIGALHCCVSSVQQSESAMHIYIHTYVTTYIYTSCFLDSLPI